MKLENLQQQLNYQFKNLSLLECALTHRSVAGEENNERLEFLGDAVLSHIIAEALFQHYPDAQEGDLSRMRSTLVRGERLADIAKTFSLGQYLKLGIGEKKSGGSDRRSILANAFEALIGAIYLDAGMEVCRRVVLTIYHKDIDQPYEKCVEKDAKSALQEWSQARKLPLPIYEVTMSGEAHAQTFEVTCFVEGLSYKTKGVSTNRRSAEQAAAKAFLELLDE